MATATKAGAAPAMTPAALAKGALRRLAVAQLEPTPENYARAYADEGGALAAAMPEAAAALLQPLSESLFDEPEAGAKLVAMLMAGQWPQARELMAQGQESRRDFAASTAETLRRMVQGLDRPSTAWPAGRRRDGVQRVLDNSRGDLHRLQQRLGSLVTAWDSDAPAATGLGTPEASGAATTSTSSHSPDAHWPALAADLNDTIGHGLAPQDSTAQALAAELAVLGQRIASEGAHAALVADVQAACVQARRLFAHRHRLVDELAALCRELGHGVTELAEDQSWARGQGEQIRARLAEGVSLRSVRAVADVLAQAREQQQALRGQRDAARDALKSMIQLMLRELESLGAQTDNFHQALGQHALAVQGADSLDDLTEVVRDMVAHSRQVQQLVGQTRTRLNDEHARALELQQRVAALEDALRKVSDEATTDALTQVANRRGLTLAFDGELARLARHPTGTPAPALSLALIDIDNFKKLNDTLGHAAGDEALRRLAAAVRERLRPGDHFARFGGEEFVVVLPATTATEACETLTRLQRSLSASLFMHGGQEVLVTFSAGVTAWRLGETLEAALERADQGLYEAKRAGKNRTCGA